MKTLLESSPTSLAAEQTLPQDRSASGGASAHSANRQDDRAWGSATTTREGATAAPGEWLGPMAAPASATSSSATQAGSETAHVGRSSRFEEWLLHHAVRFREVKADSLAAVFQSPGGTQLWLQLRRQHGQLEAYVRCEQGDLSALAAEWGSLQTALADRGVRLAALNQPPPEEQNRRSSSGTEHSTTGQQPHSRRHAPRHTRNPLDDLPMVGSVTEPLGRRPARGLVMTLRGWETWA